MRATAIVLTLGLILWGCSERPRTPTANRPDPKPARARAASTTASDTIRPGDPDPARPTPRPATGPVAHPKIGKVVEIVIENPLDKRTVSIVKRAEVAAFLAKLTTGKGGRCGCKAQFVLRFTLADGSQREAYAMAHGWKLVGPGPKLDGRVVAHIQRLFGK